MEGVKNCMGCKHYAQGKNASYCANEKQTDQGLKKYSYWVFYCGLHEKGIHQTRAEYMEGLNKENELKLIDLLNNTVK